MWLQNCCKLSYIHSCVLSQIYLSFSFWYVQICYYNAKPNCIMTMKLTTGCLIYGQVLWTHVIPLTWYLIILKYVVRSCLCYDNFFFHLWHCVLHFFSSLSHYVILILFFFVVFALKSRRVQMGLLPLCILLGPRPKHSSQPPATPIGSISAEESKGS